ncbi:hypothetical protein BDV25DRAFT_127387 [Aspergillus avenaceus]|uniref:Uncharacterized protein n=1 Tax=Aspergillus avenaceus TaxID=36643 RepID=A0A5N6U3M5_ASPAV|nr:hypothetical protein BDV25DRAFT_127387 [Aspergillus avenaceus]
MEETIRRFLNRFDSSLPVPSIRVVGDTPNSILDPNDFLESITSIVEGVKSAVIACRPQTQTCYLAVKRFGGRHSFFVLDLNNVEYDYDSAHENRSPIPVYILRLSRNPKIFRHAPQDQQLADKLAELHNLHGDDPLPLFDDHTKPIIYAFPRYLKS